MHWYLVHFFVLTFLSLLSCCHEMLSSSLWAVGAVVPFKLINH